VQAPASDGGAGNVLTAAFAAFDFSGAIGIESLTVEAREANRGPALRRLAERYTPIRLPKELPSP
jgi:hypothetical protein